MDLLDRTAKVGDVTATLTYIGEGYEGDYDPTDRNDRPLYRCDLTRDGVEYETDGGSWCTCIVANDPNADYDDIVRKIAQYAYGRKAQGHSLDHIAQSVSWFAIDNLTDQFGGAA
jgi:hypothetical protein